MDLILTIDCHKVTICTLINSWLINCLRFILAHVFDPQRHSREYLLVREQVGHVDWFCPLSLIDAISGYF